MEIQKNEFVSKLKQQVDVASIGVFSDMFDVFTPGKNEYKGEVGYDGFKIKRRRRFFDVNMNLAIATGTFQQEDEKLIIETEINGFSGMLIPFYLFGLVFYAIAIGTMLTANNFSGNGGGFPIVFFLIIHAAFMFGLPYLMMRRSLKRMKYDLEREFFYLTKK